MKASTRRRKDAAKTKRARAGAKAAKKTSGPFTRQPKGAGVYRTVDGLWHRGPSGSN